MVFGLRDRIMMSYMKALHDLGKKVLICVPTETKKKMVMQWYGFPSECIRVMDEIAGRDADWVSMEDVPLEYFAIDEYAPYK